LTDIEHQKDWLLYVLVHVEGFNPFSWGLADVADPISVEVIGPEGCGELEPQLVHDSHAKAVDGIDFSLGQGRGESDGVCLEYT